MVKIDPQQELFTKLKLLIETLGYAVYDSFLPVEETTYPFVYLGDFQQIDDANKSAVFGNVYATIHVWCDNSKNREVVSQLLLDIKTVCRQLDHTNHFAWYLRKVDQKIISDNTTNTPLLHGILEVEYKFN